MTAAAPELDELTTTVTGVELISIGTWDAATGKARITLADLRGMIDAFKNPAHDAASVKIGHDDDRFQDSAGNPPSNRDGSPAYGWVENLRLSEDSRTLVGDLVGVPKMLAEVMHTALRRRSVELVRHERVGGQVYPCVLTGLALLGVQAPAVKGLADLRALFAHLLPYDAAGGPERFSVLIDGDTPVIPQTNNATPERDRQTTDREGREERLAMKLSPIQRRSLGIADDATDEEIAKVLKAMGLAMLGEDDEEDDAKAKKAKTVTPPDKAPAAADLPVVQPPRDETGRYQPGEKASPTPVAAASTPVEAEPLTPQAVAAAAGGLGLQVVDTVMFAQLQQDAAAGRAARDEQDRVRRDGLVKDAVRKGKIAPGAFAAFRQQADADENGLIVLLAAMPEILPTQTIGHGEQFTGDTVGTERVVSDQADTQKRASVYAHFGIPVPTEKG